MPKISVLMGTYNENIEQAAQAIDSILGQTCQDFEFIICDDGSDRVFFGWLKQYCRQDPRILILRNKKNCGLAASLNRCFGHAAGVYIARMDADDISAKWRFEKQAAFLDTHQEYALVGCSAQLINGSGVWGERILKKKPDKKSFLYTSPFIHPTVMMRREVMEQLGGYCVSPKILRAEDYDFFMRLYASGYQGYNLPELLFRYREDGHSYIKRKYRYRIHECRVRYQGFRNLGILKGNLHYVAKPLVAGMVPAGCMKAFRKWKYAHRTPGV